ncbi:MAG: UDP-N-acetylmuramate dehydrogenase [Oscillospiraceae bacterium]|jgi:UDP-N-acetylmuramate dehydrogenase|nr:UDP-N-acetylmuramate dehydrogenase [Oscillospiraceae bacterium]
MRTFAEFASGLGLQVLHEALRLHTTFLIGGVADFVAVPQLSLLKKVLAALKDLGICYKVVGNGSNLLVCDGPLDMVFVKPTGQAAEIRFVGPGLLHVPAGVSLRDLCEFAACHALSGLEFAFGIPGTLGGAIYMNASAYGGQMSDVLQDVFFLDDRLQERSIAATDAKFDYRDSAFQKTSCCITAATMALRPEASSVILERMQAFWQRRVTRQPLGLPNAGSIFKRPPGFFAAALIEDCGLMGARIGDAAVSEKHAGFIVNLGKATCADVRQLITKVQGAVWQQKAVKLDLEVEFVPAG